MDLGLPAVDGVWLHPIRERIDRLIRSRGRGSPLHGSGPQPVAAFDWDNTVILNDIGEAVFFELVSSMRFRFDLDDLWNLVPADLEPDSLRYLWREAASSESIRDDFRVRFACLYHRTIESMGAREAYAWSAKLLVGMRPADVAAVVDDVIDRELACPVKDETWRANGGLSLTVARGIRVFAPVVRLMDELRDAGFRVVVVTASPRVVVARFARRIGIDGGDVGGMTNGIEDGLFTGELVPPMTYREGKVAAIERFTGALPVFAVGDAVTDDAMLCAARDSLGEALLLDKGDVELRAVAGREGWLVQPRWTHDGS